MQCLRRAHIRVRLGRRPRDRPEQTCSHLPGPPSGRPGADLENHVFDKRFRRYGANPFRRRPFRRSGGQALLAPRPSRIKGNPEELNENRGAFQEDPRISPRLGNRPATRSRRLPYSLREKAWSVTAPAFLSSAFQAPRPTVLQGNPEEHNKSGGFL